MPTFIHSEKSLDSIFVNLDKIISISHSMPTGSDSHHRIIFLSDNGKEYNWHYEDLETMMSESDQIKSIISKNITPQDPGGFGIYGGLGGGQ